MSGAHPAAARRPGPLTVDLGIALLVQLAASIPFVVARPPGESALDWLDYLTTTLTVVPLVWRRRAPVRVLLAVFAAHPLIVLSDGPGQPLPYTGLVALYTVAAQSPPRVRQFTGAAVLAVVFPSSAFNTFSVRELLFSLFVYCAAYALGRLTDTRRAYAQALEERAAQLERAARIEAEQAAARERARIAREMHDILSHAVSLMIVQAEAGPVAVRAAPERAEAAFEAISETGRDAMTQLRRMLGLLREADGAGAGRSPQPSLAELPRLMEQVRASGLRIDQVTEGAARPLPLDLEAAAYRIVQEALTNVVKHAGADRVEVHIAYGADLLELAVEDDGRGPQSGSGAEGGRGHGLIGLRERAAAYGGVVRAGARPDGAGFRVEARIPLGRLPDHPCDPSDNLATGGVT
ncbi:sensor histidine kinase [Streptomyces sp. TRM66268-LWL]|uniref:histidine kinase n=1 Tax=Streptomyces polyasparticus TaxID=2767826 RepID=A0ABR7S9A9_9ACTN|nr:sensor histidine kinase [Streptomyces polyasparticus]MBC9711709.1 sensor histidine kinase [Streptomyces polyasparticus]